MAMIKIIHPESKQVLDIEDTDMNISHYACMGYENCIEIHIELDPEILVDAPKSSSKSMK